MTMTSEKRKEKRKMLSERYESLGNAFLLRPWRKISPRLRSKIEIFYTAIINSEGLKITPHFSQFNVHSFHDQGHLQSLIR